MITQMLQNFMASLFCNYVQRMAAAHAYKTGNNVKEMYIMELNKIISNLNSDAGFNDYMDKFQLYCITVNCHTTVDNIVTGLFNENFPRGLVSQMGTHRKRAFTKKIFIKSFEECSSSLIKNSEILDMVANKADNALAPCQEIIRLGISRIFAELNSEQAVTSQGTKDSAQIKMVSVELYEKEKERCNKLQMAYTKVTTDLQKAAKKIEELSAGLDRIMTINKSLMNKIRMMETRPKELTIVGESARPIEYGLTEKNYNADMITADDSISQVMSSSRSSVSKASTKKDDIKEIKEDKKIKEESFDFDIDDIPDSSFELSTF